MLRIPTAELSTWQERAWLRATLVLLVSNIVYGAWFLYRGPVSEYLTFVALPIYMLLAAVSIRARILFASRRTAGTRTTAEITALAIFIFALLDVFDPKSTMEELDLSGPFLLAGLWCVLLDETLNLARKEGFVPSGMERVSI